LLGLVDQRAPAGLRTPALAAGETNEAGNAGGTAVERIEWNSVRGVKSEGLLASVKGESLRLIVIPISAPPRSRCSGSSPAFRRSVNGRTAVAGSPPLLSWFARPSWIAAKVS